MALLRIDRLLAAALLAALVLAFGACATRDSPALDVQLASVAVVDASLLEQRFMLTLRFTNRTDRDVAVDGLTFRLDINGREFATGVSNQAFTVPRFGEARIDAAATSTLSGVLGQIAELQKRSSGAPGSPSLLSYRLSGNANTGWSGTAFDTQSELPFPAAPR